MRSLLVTGSPFETRAALLEDGVVVELPHERRRHRGIAGNIYKGRVKKVLKGMQSAFVDIGLDRDAFLYVGDLEAARYRADGDDALPAEAEGVEARERLRIEEHLREGEELVVQVAKEPMAGKGARITTHITLPGRYLVHMPSVRHIGVSRRIEDAEERARLKTTLERVRGDADCGFIVRTAGEGQDERSLADDARFLIGQWSTICASAAAARPPQLVHSELGLLDKLLRDLVAGDFGEIVVDRQVDFDRCVGFLNVVDPTLVARVRLQSGPGSVFDAYGVEDEIQKALRSRVWLKSGGYIVINQTEALVAIDVNTGRYVGKVCLEDTALRTNLEAVGEVVRQIRLRDLGGIIVIDFIDLDEAANRAQVVAAIEEALKDDRSKTKSLQISDFGLVEMTRKRVRVSLERLLLRSCPSCGGSGRIKSAETVCYEVLRELLRARERLKPGVTVEVRVHADVARALSELERGSLRELGDDLATRFEVRADPGFHPEHYELAYR